MKSKFTPIAIAAALVGGSFFVGQETAVEPPAVPAVYNPCPEGFTYSEILGDVAVSTCSSDPYVVAVDPNGNPLRAMDTTRGEIPVSEVPGWE